MSKNVYKRNKQQLTDMQKEKDKSREKCVWEANKKPSGQKKNVMNEKCFDSDKKKIPLLHNKTVK